MIIELNDQSHEEKKSPRLTRFHGMAMDQVTQKLKRAPNLTKITNCKHDDANHHRAPGERFNEGGLVGKLDEKKVGSQ